MKRTYRRVPSERAGYGPGQWVVQYKDTVIGRWFDVGDPLSEEDAQRRLDELRAAQ
jgi:hypothetical protein